MKWFNGNMLAMILIVFLVIWLPNIGIISNVMNVIGGIVTVFMGYLILDDWM